MDKFLDKFSPETQQEKQPAQKISGVNSRRTLVARTAMALVMQATGCASFSAAIEEPADGGEEAGTDSGADTQADIGLDMGIDTSDANDAGETGDAADAGPQGTFSNTPGENECIHWATRNGGMTQAFASDNHVCEPKPLSPMPIQKGDLVYVWDKHNLSANKVRFASPFNVVNYYSKCSGFSLPPDKKEMETDLGTGGFVAIANAATLPNVELTNGGCTNGAAYAVQIQP